MGMPVVTVAAGGLPVVESTNGFGIPVTEANPKFGVAVTKIVDGLGLPVIFETIGIVASVTYATWDPNTVAAQVTLSGGNLVTTNTGTTGTNQGACGVNAFGQTTGKYYFESTLTAFLGGGNNGIGAGIVTTPYTSIGPNGTGGTMMYGGSGNIYSNGANSGFTLGARSTGNVIGVAIDLDNRKAWYRVAPSGNWDGNATHNPVTNTGGVAIPAGTIIPFCTFGGIGGVSNNVITANFGASSFTGAVPSVFTAGWPA